jgi:hypothetical protein
MQLGGADQRTERFVAALHGDVRAGGEGGCRCRLPSGTFGSASARRTYWQKVQMRAVGFVDD